jgi:flagellar basal-body rod protein FlgB
MDFTNLTVFSLMKSKLDYMSERQGVLAQNVANADTPNYKAKDIQAPNFEEMARKSSNPMSRTLPLTRTSEKHITPQVAASHFGVEKRKTTDELNPNGNNVVIEEEMMKIGQNQAEYQKVLNLYGKTIGMFKTALGRNGG